MRRRPPVLDAKSLAKEFETDSAAADRKYAEKSVIVSGEVAGEERKEKAITLTLKSSPNISLICKFGGYGREQNKKFTAGDKVKIYGEPAQFRASTVVLENCQLIVE